MGIEPYIGSTYFTSQLITFPSSGEAACDLRVSPECRGSPELACDERADFCGTRGSVRQRAATTFERPRSSRLRH